MILKKEILTTVPIGLPLPNCDVVLVGEDAPYQGEIYVGGLCTAAGYFHYPNVIPLAGEDLSPEYEVKGRVQPYFKTGDFARKLRTGELVFLGRKDRIVKVNGQRIALEEIENVLREHPNVVDAAVLSREFDGDIVLLEAHVVKGRTAEDDELLKTSLRNLLHSKLPLIMVPSRILLIRSLPFLSSGKVDYSSLAPSSATDRLARINIHEIPENRLIHVINQVFSEALTVERVSIDDDFFAMGGDSVSAAYVSFKLGIHMKLLYSFPTPMSLRMALLSSSSSEGSAAEFGVDLSKPGTKISNFHERAVDHSNIANPIKKLKVSSKEETSEWNPTAVHVDCSFSRSNKNTHGGGCKGKCSLDTLCANIIPRDGKGFMQELWKIDMGSCVDASPLVVFRESDIYLFIGSHSQKFICIDGRSGVVHWEAKLEGRIECSAAILDDFSQVVVGCYHGNIYFLHFSSGNVCGSFHTDGEVKSQPVVDKCRHLVWCGSYDHNLYAIDYRNYSCVYKLPCKGSIFGSPAINELKEKLYVASTSGHVTALEIKMMPFKTLWERDMGAPVFGSLRINYSDGNIICCLVDGTVVVISKCGFIVWKVRTGGPIFAAPCMSPALPSQVLVCSRDGNIYSFEVETGSLIWKHEIGNPITSSPYVDEDLKFTSTSVSNSSDRLICVCDSSGGICVLRIDRTDVEGTDGNKKDAVHEFARLNLDGDIFSSPVMIGGRIFVGCRNDHVYCIKLDVE